MPPATHWRLKRLHQKDIDLDDISDSASYHDSDDSDATFRMAGTTATVDTKKKDTTDTADTKNKDTTDTTNTKKMKIDNKTDTTQPRPEMKIVKTTKTVIKMIKIPVPVPRTLTSTGSSMDTHCQVQIVSGGGYRNTYCFKLGGGTTSHGDTHHCYHVGGHYKVHIEWFTEVEVGPYSVVAGVMTRDDDSYADYADYADHADFQRD